jgi:hypothetical protein
MGLIGSSHEAELGFHGAATLYVCVFGCQLGYSDE